MAGYQTKYDYYTGLHVRLLLKIVFLNFQHVQPKYVLLVFKTHI